MYSVGGSEAVSRDMDSLLLSSNFKFSSQGEFAKSKEMMNSDLYDYNNNNQYLHHQQQQQQQSSNLTRYRSAPNSFFASLLDNSGGGGGSDGSRCENYINPEPSSPESEIMFSRFNSGETESRDLKYPTNLKQEITESIPQQNNDYSVAAATEMVFATPPNHNSLSAIPSVRVMKGMEIFNQVKKSSSENCSNLIRQSSSPAGFLSNLADEIGFGMTNDVGNFKTSNQTNIEANSSTSRLNNHMNFSSGPSSRFMPQISENGNENVGTGNRQNGHLMGSGQNGDHANRCYLPSIPNDSTFTSLKRNRDGEVKMFSNLNGLDTRNGDSKHYTSGLVHQLSLPSTSAEMATIDNFLQFQQDSVPCKIRAKRGFATHPRSIAERVRRTRISERMKKLQDLFPNMDKQANTADMLDLAVEYIKDLQKEVQTLNATRARCTCSSKRKQTSPTA